MCPILLALIAIQGCTRNASPPPAAPDAWSPEPSEAREEDEDEIVGTSTVFDGSYELATPPESGAPTLYVFTPGGAFSRSFGETEGEVRPPQSGTYLVDGKGRIVLYVERVGSGLLTVAVPETVSVKGDPGDALTLGSEGRELTYMRTGPAPAKSQGGPAAE
jgi:hypothetical protein